MTVFTNKQGKNAGTLIDGVFSKRINESKHTCWKHNAFGIDRRILNNLAVAGCDKIVLQGKKGKYTATLQDFREHGIKDRLGNEDTQYFLPLKNWKQT